jgi:peptidoglycan hydrolase-like protein with peptidoglycan-binding domain
LKSSRTPIIWVIVILIAIAIGAFILTKNHSNVVSSPSACANNSLSQDANGHCVTDAQDLLNWSLYGIDGPDYKKVTGQFSSVTAAEVSQYQNGNSLSQTGSLNKATWQKLCADGSDSTPTWTSAAKDAGCKT